MKLSPELEAQLNEANHKIGEVIELISKMGAGRETSLAMTKADECFMWVQQAVYMKHQMMNPKVTPLEEKIP